MIRIIGEGIIPESQSFNDVRNALDFSCDVVLGSHMAVVFGGKIAGTVIYNMEPLYDGCRSFSVGYEDVLRSNYVLDYSEENVKYLKSIGIDAFHMPYGYHKSLERIVEAKKDIDVLFFGSSNERRDRLLKSLHQEVKFVWAKGFYGEDLDSLVARAKVVLNVHYCESHQLEVVRLNYLMANHCTVVTERGNEEKVNKAYNDGVIFAREDELLQKCLYAIDNQKDGYDCIINMKQDCTKAQKWLNERMI